jgi:hypothetical protein
MNRSGGTGGGEALGEAWIPAGGIMNHYRVPMSYFSATFLLTFSISLGPGAFAQTQSAATAGPAVPRMYDAAKETVVSGTISEVVTRPKAGLPLGLHLMVSTAQGQEDVQLGPYFARIAEQKGLVPGATIQVTGVSSHFAAGDVFLARTVTIGNQTITIRNRNGFPVRPAARVTRTVRGMQSSGAV